MRAAVDSVARSSMLWGKEFRTSIHSGTRARQTSRFFCARFIGREGDGYNTPKGERSPPGCVRGSNLLAALSPTRLEPLRREFSELAQESGMSAITRVAAQPIVTLVDGHAVTTSKAVADYFHKQHKHVLEKIASLLQQAGEWGQPNFRHTLYADPQNSQQYPAYEITRDGFALLAMGFTGRRALQFKLAYIDAFNRMEAALREPPARNHYHLPATQWRPSNRVGATGWIAYDELVRLGQQRPIARLLAQLKREGNDVAAAELEYQAMNHILEMQYWFLSDIHRLAERGGRIGLNITLGGD